DLIGDASAGRVDEPYDGQLFSEGDLGGAHDLLHRARTPRSGFHHGVVGDHHDRAAVDRTPPGDDAVGWQAGVDGVGEGAVLDEGVVVDERVDALAGGELVLAPELLEASRVGFDD